MITKIDGDQHKNQTNEKHFQKSNQNNKRHVITNFFLSETVPDCMSEEENTN